jgi:hypothetical protein
VSDGFHAHPHRGRAHRREVLGGQADRSREEVRDRVAPGSGRRQLGEPLYVVLRERRSTVVDEDVRLPDRDPVDGEPVCRRFEHQVPTGGLAVHSRLAATLADQCVQVFDFALDRVGRRVAALSPAAPVVAVDSEVLRQ